MIEKDSSRSDALRVHYLEQTEFIQLLVSRRRLARLWLRSSLMGSKSFTALRDLQTGDVYVVRESVRGAIPGENVSPNQ